MSAMFKLFRSGKEKKKNGNHYLDIGEIGMPTQVSHNFSGKINPDGTIAGIPESWKQRLKLMITSEEAENPEKAEKAAQLCKWIDTRVRDGQSEEFMRVNSDSPSNSVMSTETNSELSFVSSSGERVSGEESLSEAPEDVEATEPVVTNPIDNEVLNAADKTVCDNDVPTLRRKKKERTTRQGPRVTRNLTEEQIMSQLQDACRIASPWEHYQKASAWCQLHYILHRSSHLFSTNSHRIIRIIA